jgi:FAD/FMN-containing dehydrogenase
MGDLKIKTLNGREAIINAEAIEGLRAKISGEVMQAGAEGYEDARTIWNAMIDRKPGIIIQCRGNSDVITAVNFARDNGALISVKGAGHNIAGNSVCDGGIMIDLSLMKSVRVDPEKKRAYVEPGATLGDVDNETQKFGLAVPTGINSTTGISGLTLGGGFGWLTRKYGMTVDNLVSADVITADGNLLHANEKENSDLFWAIRGGGGNFGIVTMFEFALNQLGPEVLTGLFVFPFKHATEIINKYREYVKGLTEDLTVWVVLRKAPPLPFLPEEVHGKEVVIMAFLYAGEVSEGKRVIEPIRSFAEMHGEHVGPNPFAGWQQAFDPLLTPGSRNYWKSHNFTELSDGAIDAIIEFAGKLPTPQCEIFIASVEGKANRVASDAMAYANRETKLFLNVHGRWEDKKDDDHVILWARAFFEKSAPYASGSVYVNFMSGDETDRVRQAYGPNYDRLVKAKNKYDPKNLFKINQNIKPTI